MNGAQHVHGVERGRQRRWKERGDEPAPGPRAAEDQVQTGNVCAGEAAEQLHSLSVPVILDHLLHHEVVERSARDQQVPEVRRRPADGASFSSFTGLRHVIEQHIDAGHQRPLLRQATCEPPSTAPRVEDAPPFDRLQTSEQSSVRILAAEDLVLLPIGGGSLALDPTPDAVGFARVQGAHFGRDVESHRRGRVRRLAGLGVAAVAAILAGCSDELPPPPPQPIAFNHSVHIENEIDCTRCHEGVETQAQAGLPAMAECASCHRRQATDHPAVQAFMEQYANGNGEPMVWRKVHVMPASAMVHFKHSPHVRAGVECSTCHGDVAQMTVAQQVVDVANMGWCLDCHREQGASIDCMTCHH